MWTLAVVACAILAPHSHARTEEIARIEAQAFIEAATPHVPLETLLGVAWAESRFGPDGSQTDRDLGVWGVMQLLAPELRCFNRRGHDDPRRCSPDVLRRRVALLDPATNITLGAAQLEHRRRQWRHHTYASLWVGAYYVGSIPHTAGPAFGQFLRYARRVRIAESFMRARLEQCRSAESSGEP